MSATYPLRRMLAAIVTVIAGALTSAAAGQAPAVGRITGVVSDPEDRPAAFTLLRLPDGSVAVADEEGRFTLDEVAAGRAWIAAVGPGCVVHIDSVRVAEGRTSSVRLQVPFLSRGEAERREGVVGMSRAELARRNFRSVYEVLRTIAPYMIGHMTGEIGGARSLSNRSARTFEGNEPLVLLDGIRLTNVSVAALEAVPVEDLERIEVVRGAAAAWRYGIGSAAGAIVLTSTRSGLPDPALDLTACEVVFPPQG